MIKEITRDTIFTYIGFPLNGEEDTYWIYDPRTNKHYEIDKKKYEEVMKNVNHS